MGDRLSVNINNMKGGRFEFKRHELDKALKVFAWSFGSAMVVLLLNLVDAIDFPVQYAWAVPLVNSILYAAKEWIADNR